ncbi:hypothetical protein BDF19DRAFT_438948 [Syncephalis fuscata]|nr:hypothetical protein BDF19DRAFT_438948 [Syncephalis fuscata]
MTIFSRRKAGMLKCFASAECCLNVYTIYEGRNLVGTLSKKNGNPYFLYPPVLDNDLNGYLVDDAPYHNLNFPNFPFLYAEIDIKDGRCFIKSLSKSPGISWEKDKEELVPGVVYEVQRGTVIRFAYFNCEFIHVEDEVVNIRTLADIARTRYTDYATTDENQDSLTSTLIIPLTNDVYDGNDDGYATETIGIRPRLDSSQTDDKAASYQPEEPQGSINKRPISMNEWKLEIDESPLMQLPIDILLSKHKDPLPKKIPIRRIGSQKSYTNTGNASQNRLSDEASLASTMVIEESNEGSSLEGEGLLWLQQFESKVASMDEYTSPILSRISCNESQSDDLEIGTQLIANFSDSQDHVTATATRPSTNTVQKCIMLIIYSLGVSLGVNRADHISTFTPCNVNEMAASNTLSNNMINRNATSKSASIPPKNSILNSGLLKRCWTSDFSMTQWPNNTRMNLDRDSQADIIFNSAPTRLQQQLSQYEPRQTSNAVTRTLSEISESHFEFQGTEAPPSMIAVNLLANKRKAKLNRYVEKRKQSYTKEVDELLSADESDSATTMSAPIDKGKSEQNEEKQQKKHKRRLHDPEILRNLISKASLNCVEPKLGNSIFKNTRGKGNLTRSTPISSNHRHVKPVETAADYDRISDDEEDSNAPGTSSSVIQSRSLRPNAIPSLTQYARRKKRLSSHSTRPGGQSSYRSTIGKRRL